MTDHDTPRFGAAADIRFDRGVAELLSYLGELGLDHLELRQGYRDTHEVPPPTELRRLADEHGVTYTVHAPFRDCALEHRNDALREAAVEAVRASLEFAAAIDAGGVVVHGGGARTRYPDDVVADARSRAVTSLRTCGRYAAAVGVPLCLENAPATGSKRRHTTTPDGLAALAADVGLGPSALRFTLDVGHARTTGHDLDAFLDVVGDRVQVAHLHANDGADDDHDPLPSFRSVAADVGAPYNVLEMKSLADVARCVGAPATAPPTA